MAGPGTGKTRTLLGKALQLIEEEVTMPADLRIANFTNAGVSDLRKKLVADHRYSAIDPRNVTTFHSLALGCLLRARSPSVPSPLLMLDDWGERTFVDQFVKDQLGIRDIRQARRRRDDYNSRWCMASEEVSDWLSQRDRSAYESVYRRVKDILGFTTRGELTFLWWRFLGSQPGVTHAEAGFPWSHLLVDEYQDLNECEHEILQMLSAAGVSVFAVGDPNQSIYEGMRHAHPELCWSFHERLDPGENRILNQSYRCPRDVLRLAQALFADPIGVPDPEQSPNRGEAEILAFPSSDGEASGLTRLVRHLISTDPLARVLITVPDRRIAPKFVQELSPHVTVEDRTLRPSDGPEQCRLARAILELIREPQNGVAAATAIILRCGDTTRARWVVELFNLAARQGLRIAQVYNDGVTLPPPLERARRWTHEAADQVSNSGSPLATLAELTGCEAEAPSLEETEMEITTRLDEEKQLAPGAVTIMTMHSCKGMEAEYVILPGTEPGLVERDFVGAAKEERRRLLYVGMTRPMRGLFVTYAITRSGPTRHSNPLNQSIRAGPSEFLQEVAERTGYRFKNAQEFLQQRLK